MTDSCEVRLHKEIAVLQERLSGMERARELQAEEYARRLDELNHAHQIAQERNANYIGRETFEAFVTEWDKWRRDVDNERAVLRGNKSGIYAAGSAIIAVLAFLVAIARWWADGV